MFGQGLWRRAQSGWRTSPGRPRRFLSLSSEVAEERPLLCAVDDELWLDRASAQALSFVGRRFGMESVGLVFSARARTHELTGLPPLVIEGLKGADAL